MDVEWQNIGSERNPRFEHVHADGTMHKSDRTIPMLTVESRTRRRAWRARVICRECRADLERRWVEGG